MRLTMILKIVGLLGILHNTNVCAQDAKNLQKSRNEYIQKELDISEEKAVTIGNIIDQSWKKQRLIIMDTLEASSVKQAKMKQIPIERDEQLELVLSADQLQRMRVIITRLKAVTDSIRKSIKTPQATSKKDF